MTIPVLPSSFAEDEIEHYVRGYELESTGLGDRLWHDIQTVVPFISEYPEVGETVRRTGGSVRRFPLKRFPFLLIYRRRNDHLQIVALAHTRRKPNHWRSRLKSE